MGEVVDAFQEYECETDSEAQYAYARSPDPYPFRYTTCAPNLTSPCALLFNQRTRYWLEISLKQRSGAARFRASADRHRKHGCAPFPACITWDAGTSLLSIWSWLRSWYHELAITVTRMLYGRRCLLMLLFELSILGLRRDI